jgi:hypothetical protein
MNLQPSFHCHEILCVEHDHTYLYSELVQVVELRQLCWVRPLALLIKSHPSIYYGTSAIAAESGLQDHTVYDLQDAVDLLLPQKLFRATLDSELLPLLTQLGALKQREDSGRLAHQQLQSFIWQVWQTNTQMFPAKNEPY